MRHNVAPGIFQSETHTFETFPQVSHGLLPFLPFKLFETVSRYNFIYSCIFLVICQKTESKICMIIQNSYNLISNTRKSFLCPTRVKLKVWSEPRIIICLNSLVGSCVKGFYVAAVQFYRHIRLMKLNISSKIPM